MIRSHLSRLMGEKRVRIIDIARATGISRNLLAKLYHDRARRIDIDDLGKLCQYFECAVGDLLESSQDVRIRQAKRGRSSHSRQKSG